MRRSPAPPSQAVSPVAPVSKVRPGAPQQPGGAAAPVAWRHDVAVPVLPHVLRLTAPNPGRMTGPGTNSYLVGTPASGYAVIDPGPDLPEHQRRLWDLAAHADGSGGNIRMIICTHAHADHAPGAWPLQALCAQRPAVLGMPSGPHARPGSAFRPDRALQHQEVLALSAAPSDAGAYRLRVLHTPGHASNHLCLLLQGDGLLFSGDHILSGSSTVIDPPDGNMTAYLESLDVLAALSQRREIRAILPAHGDTLEDPEGVIAQRKAHRLWREEKIAKVLRAQPHASDDALLALAYDDVDRGLWPVAKRSLLAHLERLRAPPKPAPRADGERLSKRVMQLRACSRREAEQYIVDGWVAVDGTPVFDPALRVAQQRVSVDPQAQLTTAPAVTLLLHKPAGLADGLDPDVPGCRSLLTLLQHSAHDDSGVRPLPRHLHPLDADTPLETGASGLVVFTQDWRVTRKLREDMALLEHEYFADVAGTLSPAARTAMEHALARVGAPAAGTRFSVGSSSAQRSRLRFAIRGAHPGLVAHLCQAAGLELLALQRVRLGRVALRDLAPGQWRYLAANEKF